MKPYEVLRNVLQDNLLDMYEFPFLVEEATQLEVDTVKKKVDHRPRGSKDVVDTLAGSVYNAVTFALENPSLVSLVKPKTTTHKLCLGQIPMTMMKWLFTTGLQLE